MIPYPNCPENNDFPWILKPVEIEIFPHGWVQGQPHNLDTTTVSAIEFYPDMVFLDKFEAFLWPVGTLPGLGVHRRRDLKNAAIWFHSLFS